MIVSYSSHAALRYSQVPPKASDPCQKPSPSRIDTCPQTHELIAHSAPRLAAAIRLSGSFRVKCGTTVRPQVGVDYVCWRGSQTRELDRYFFYPRLLLADTDMFSKSFQEKMKANFQAYFSRGGWSHKRPDIEEKLVFDYNPAEGQMQYIGTAPQPVDFLVDYSFDLLKAGRDRMRKCERCKKPFVEKRKGRARFCSRKCSAYVKLKNWREKEIKKKRIKQENRAKE
jgi:hypothetical protein